MAAAEAACHDGTSFSVLTVGELGAQSRAQTHPTPPAEPCVIPPPRVGTAS